VKKLFKIGNKEYKYKKDAIAHYRKILNSYDFGQSLNDDDFYDLIDLLNYHPNDADDNEIECEPDDFSPKISDIKVSRVQFGVKCFEIFYDDNTSRYISYIMFINGKSDSYDDLFYKACRSAIWSDIHKVKSRYFKGTANRMAICQETGILSGWSELVIDHRQPNSFSVIVDRFKEVFQISVETVEYSTDEKNNIVFSDETIASNFRQYHSEKANLRIVRKERNLSRTGLAKIKRTSKDLTIK